VGVAKGDITTHWFQPLTGTTAEKHDALKKSYDGSDQ
jgi:glutamine synthetase